MIGSLTDLSRRPGMPSEVTLRKLIARHADFPIVRHGTHGRKYRINLKDAEKFVLGLRERRQLAAVERQALIREFGLNMPLVPIASQGTDSNG